MKKLILVALLASASTLQAQELTRAQMRDIRSVCEADIKSHCAGIQPGGGRLMQCVQAKQSEISAPCREVLIAVKAERQKTN